MYDGRCLCGEVRYQINAELQRLVNCHCQRCRSMNGSAFSSYLVIKQEHFCLTQGEEKLSRFAVSEHIWKSFCSSCGTAIFNANPVTYPGLRMLYLGSLPEAQKMTPTINIFCESKLAWVDQLASIDSVVTCPRPAT